MCLFFQNGIKTGIKKGVKVLSLFSFFISRHMSTWRMTCFLLRIPCFNVIKWRKHWIVALYGSASFRKPERCKKRRRLCERQRESQSISFKFRNMMPWACLSYLPFFFSRLLMCLPKRLNNLNTLSPTSSAWSSS